MFTATAPVPILDHLRVPYAVQEVPDHRGVGRLRAADGSHDRELAWVPAQHASRAARTSGVFEVAGCRLAGHVLTGSPSQELSVPGSWTVLHDVVDLQGRRVAAVEVSARGDVLLPFDPSAVMADLWAERYRGLDPTTRMRTLAREVAVHGYYQLRPALPRAAQLALRRRVARHPALPLFPRWPVEPGLQDMYGWFLGLLTRVAGSPVPWVSPWPDGARWCLVLTHDVETAAGCADLERLREPERAAGFRSSWNFVPERYETPPEIVHSLRDEGCEIGVHGLRHDGRDLASARLLRRRTPGMLAAAARWGATGFRSPATQRRWSLMPELGFDYDSSYTDTDPYEPQPGGCCSWWPFFNEDLVELPITLPQDHTLFAVLGHQDGSLWLDKLRELRRRGGMALVLSHPDYAKGAALQAWRDLLTEAQGDPTMWQPLPREVASWWRARAASSLVLRDGSWTLEGPAASAGTVVQTSPARVSGGVEASS